MFLKLLETKPTLKADFVFQDKVLIQDIPLSISMKMLSL